MQASPLKARLSRLLFCRCCASLLLPLSLFLGGSLPAQAQTAASQEYQGPYPSEPRLTECKAARDPERCEAVVKVRLQCQDLRGAKRRACLEDNLPPPDCDRARNPRRCKEDLAVNVACQGKLGEDRRDCKREQRKLLRGQAARK